MASESGGDHGGGMSGYISHHLHHLSTKEQHSLIDFSVVHKDTLFFSLLCAAITLLLLRLAARKATPGVPGKFQCAVEMLVEMVDEQAKTLVQGQPHLRRAARADGVRLGRAHERDRPAAGRPAAVDRAHVLRRRVPATAADRRPERRHRPVARHAAAGPLLQRQDQRARWLAARADVLRRSAWSS